jgi:hypothetical protein
MTENNFLFVIQQMKRFKKSDFFYRLVSQRNQIKRKETIMSEQCELLDKCGFFLNYRGNSEVVIEGWIIMFCENKEKSEKCERKKIRKQTGKPPADNMTPTGRMLP